MHFSFLRLWGGTPGLGVPVACLTHGHAVLVAATPDAFEARYIVTQPVASNVISATVLTQDQT